MGKTETYIFLSILVVSLVSLIGIGFLTVRRKALDRILHILISLAVGGMIGGAALHLIPEALNLLSPAIAIVFVLAGFAVFLMLEKLMHWNHDHLFNNSELKIFGPLNLLADLIHNFLDGVLIAAAFQTDIRIGFVTTFIVLMHEIPQEIGDFGILVKAGYKPLKALIFNFISSLSAFLGAFTVIFFSSLSENIEAFLVPVAAGGFIYLAIVDLIPEIFGRHKNNPVFSSVVSIIVGFLLVFLITFFEV